MTRATSLNRGLLALPDPATTRRAFLVGLGATGLGACASNPVSGTLRAAETPEIPDGFREWIVAFRPRALGRGISAATYDRVMNSVVPETSVFKSDKSQPETIEPIWRYVDRRTNEYNVATGRKRIQEYAALWDRIEARYGVDRHLLCALWGLESSFGDLAVSTKYMKPVMNCLAALAWGEPRRRTYWEAELLNGLVIIDRGWAEPSGMIGSWAGAMGHTQWMPEVWLNMGVDFDGDGKINPFGKPDDALAGTARYMVERGKYRRGEAWGYEVSFDPGFDLGDADGKTRHTIAHWTARGMRRADGQPFPRSGDIARIWLPAGAKGPAFALLQNFYAVRSYNPSNKYALAICHLSDKIRGNGTFIHPWPTQERLLTLAETQEMQEKLTAMGFDTGGADGRAGEKTQSALQAWQKSVGMQPADGYPSDKVLERLRGG
ncbi:lytic murein transglycosylase [Pinisolibacter aquiterrae]|uniref:lytic murein transglycosylase n=1 Tax=Pinisolibacter aquiterrae TaxID=2815579 RepID=UPI001C3DC492|nr:lytic murein transglycosylase [Pinisolibacter aquiterrae]MBV5263664.1 lytic murein transglycosylase [Pinisolibacter aquiterrae]MCC8235138.1 lytic murein transglycosylase [Pinisolibacter aquiterrae]